MGSDYPNQTCICILLDADMDMKILYMLDTDVDMDIKSEIFFNMDMNIDIVEKIHCFTFNIFKRTEVLGCYLNICSFYLSYR